MPPQSRFTFHVFTSRLFQFFQSLHSMFVAEIQNPFQAIGEPISSSQFQNKVQRAINTFHAIDSRSAGQHL